MEKKNLSQFTHEGVLEIIYDILQIENRIDLLMKDTEIKAAKSEIELNDAKEHLIDGRVAMQGVLSGIMDFRMKKEENL